MIKKRILFVGEASVLSTGFSTYFMEVIKRLYNPDKWDIRECASYIKPSDKRISSVPWKIYPAMPDDNDEEAKRIFNMSRTNQFGEWIFPYVCIDFMPHIVFDARDSWMLEFEDRSIFRDYFNWLIMPTVDSCLLPDTKIITDSGYKKIQDIKHGEIVLTHNGKLKTVERSTYRNYSGKIYTIRAYGFGIPVSFTSTHPVLTIKYNGQKWTHDNRRHRSCNHKYNDAQWIEAKNIQKGDYVVFPVNKNNKDLDKIDLLKFTDNIKNITFDNNFIYYKKNRSPRFLYLNKDVLRLFGFFMSEGSISNNASVCISMCYSKEKHILNEIFYTIKNNLLIDPVIRKSKSCDSGSVTFYNALIARIFNNIFYNKNKYTVRRCGNVLIPQFILDLPFNKSIHVIEAMILGDGCITNTSHQYTEISYSTISYDLLYGVFSILLKGGILSSMFYSTGNKSYKLSILGVYAKNLYGLFDNTNYKKNKQIKFGYLNNNKNWIDKDTGNAILKVKSVQISQYSGLVYNCDVQDDKSYVTSFAVHNCPQKTEWLDTYSRADHVLAYSHFGKNELCKDPRIAKKFYDIASPGVDLNIFRPLSETDKEKFKQTVGFPPGSKIVLFVARNQKRKLFPRLMEAVKRCIDKYEARSPEFTKKLFLYIHTSYPDVGWDIPEIIRRSGLDNKVVMTYLCPRCHTVFPSFFNGVLTICRICGFPEARVPNTGMGIDRDSLSKIYQLSDLYIQSSIGEGCLRFGAKVVTENYQIKEIQNIKPNDIVYTHNGNFQKVTKTFNRKYNGNIIKIRIGGNSEPLELTSEHPVYAIKRKGCNGERGKKRVCVELCSNQKRWNCYKKWYKDYKVEFVEAKDLTINDLVAIPINTNNYINDHKIFDIVRDKYILNNNYIMKSDDQKCNKIKNVNISQIQKLIGFYVSQGSLSKNKSTVSFSFHSKKIKLIKSCEKEIKKIGLKFNSRQENYGGRNFRWKITTNSIILHNILHILCGKGAHNKHIPSEYTNSKIKMCVPFIKSLYDGDGCIQYAKDNLLRIYYTTVSATLAYQLRAILTNSGIISNIKYSKKRGSYDIQINGSEAINFANLVGYKIKENINIVKRNYHRMFIKDGYMFSPIRKIESYKFNGPVYNIQVENDNSYVSYGFAVHNCGIPAQEAKSSGVPVISAVHSAMGEKVSPDFPYPGHGRSGGGIPIKTATTYVEPETLQVRNLFDVEDCADKIYEIIGPQSINEKKNKYSKTKTERYLQLRTDARKCAEQFYDWKKTAKILGELFESINIEESEKKWKDPNLKEYKSKDLPNVPMNKAEVVRWCIANIARSPERVNTYGTNKLIQDFDIGYAVNEYGQMIPVNGKTIVESAQEVLKAKNHFEKLRHDKVKGASIIDKKVKVVKI